MRGVAAGDAVFGPGVAQRVLSQLNRPEVAAPPFPSLTARELDVLELLAAGAPSATAAAQLAQTTKTIGNHISNILTKLQLSDRSQAAVVARNAGLGRRN